MKPHIVISGPGRSGTTFLVQLLGQLGFDVGEGDYFDEVRAGLEAGILDKSAPHVVKSPDLAFELPRLIASGRLEPRSIGTLIVPMREINQVAASRIDNTLRAMDLFAPGGIGGPVGVRRVAAERALATYAFLREAARYEIPVVLLAYPRLATDAEYCRRRLSPLLNCSTEEFTLAWKSVVRPAFVRDEEIELPTTAGVTVTWLRVKLKARWLYEGTVAPRRGHLAPGGWSSGPDGEVGLKRAGSRRRRWR